jgi:hypothetical protein
MKKRFMLSRIVALSQQCNKVGGKKQHVEHSVFVQWKRVRRGDGVVLLWGEVS